MKRKSGTIINILLVFSAFWILADRGSTVIAAAPIANSSFDNLIVPGDRIGPVGMGKAVSEIVRQLGKPDKEWRSKFRGPGYDADEVHYIYNRYGIWFTWMDKGLQPVVESGLRGICVDSNRWRTSKGLRVGCSIQDVINAYGDPDHVFGATTDKPECTLWYNSGIVFQAKNRNSPIYCIYIVPAGEFGG
jgi:hypothetical protein